MLKNVKYAIKAIPFISAAFLVLSAKPARKALAVFRWAQACLAKTISIKKALAKMDPVRPIVKSAAGFVVQANAALVWIAKKKP